MHLDVHKEPGLISFVNTCLFETRIARLSVLAPYRKSYSADCQGITGICNGHLWTFHHAENEADTLRKQKGKQPASLQAGYYSDKKKEMLER